MSENPYEPPALDENESREFLVRLSPKNEPRAELSITFGKLRILVPDYRPLYLTREEAKKVLLFDPKRAFEPGAMRLRVCLPGGRTIGFDVSHVREELYALDAWMNRREMSGVRKEIHRHRYDAAWIYAALYFGWMLMAFLELSGYGSISKAWLTTPAGETTRTFAVAAVGGSAAVIFFLDFLRNRVTLFFAALFYTFLFTVFIAALFYRSIDFGLFHSQEENMLYGTPPFFLLTGLGMAILPALWFFRTWCRNARKILLPPD